jgi:hypothetical protein
MSGGKSATLIALIFSLFLFSYNIILADPIGQIDTVGITWHELQWGINNAGPQIAIDSLYGNIYIIWTLTHAWNYWYTGETGFNYYSPSEGWAYGDTGVNIFPGMVEDHMNHSIMLLENTGSKEDIELFFLSNDIYQGATRGWWSINHFETSILDSIVDPIEFSPLCAKASNGLIQIIAGGVGNNYSGLFHGSYSPNTNDFSGWESLDTLTGPGIYAIAASPVSAKMALTYLKQYQFISHGTGHLDWDQDVYLDTSPDGMQWANQQKINISHFNENDAFRANYGSDIIIDNNNNTHIAFCGFAYDINRHNADSSQEARDMGFIWHWSEDADSFTIAVDGWLRDPRESFGYGQTFNIINRPHFAINPSNGYIYLLYERYRSEDRCVNAFSNADLWVTVSTNNGLNWSTGTNITDTATPGCYTDCSSEVQASLYNIVDDTLHIVYILDKQPGLYHTSPWHEGIATQNYVIYQKIAANLITTTPLVEQYSIREGPPRCLYVIGDINGDSLTNLSDVLYAVNYFEGRGVAPSVSCSCPRPGNPFFGAGDVNGNCVFNGMDVTFYVAYLKGRYEKLRFCYDCPPYPRYTGIIP